MFYKQPKPETIARNKEANKKLYAAEIKWLSENLDLIQSNTILLNSKISLAGAERNFLISQFNLLSAVGRLTAKNLNLK